MKKDRRKAIDSFTKKQEKIQLSNRKEKRTTQKFRRKAKVERRNRQKKHKKQKKTRRGMTEERQTVLRIRK